jgi:hypothetical protein
MGERMGDEKESGRRCGGLRKVGGLIGRKLSARAILKEDSGFANEGVRISSAGSRSVLPALLEA